MPRKLRVDNPMGIYHVMQRGGGKQIIFENDRDYKYYLKKLGENKSLFDIQILAYCLMENHIHLLLKTDSIDNISHMMHCLDTSYAKYYNDKYLHVGHVFQGRFNCENVDSEAYLFTCIRYIHNNPVKAGIAARESYKWSSYHEYILGKGLSDMEYILSMIGGVSSFVALSHIKDDTKVMDCYHRVLTTKDGIEFIKSKYGYEVGETTAIKSLRKKERNIILSDLKNNGYTVKQIERITGVSRAIIYKA